VILGKEKGLGQIRIIIWLRIMGGNHRFGNRQDIPLRMIIYRQWLALVSPHLDAIVYSASLSF